MNNFARPARTLALSATSFILSAIATVFVISLLAACAGRPVSSAPGSSSVAARDPAKKTMRAFGSEEELKNYFRRLAEDRKRELARGRNSNSENSPAAPSAVLNQASTDAKAGEGLANKDESVTNTQHAGVDEGGIVKLHGDHLVVLRRGRLFTVAIGDNALKPISAVNAFGPDTPPGTTRCSSLPIQWR